MNSSDSLEQTERQAARGLPTRWRPGRWISPALVIVGLLMLVATVYVPARALSITVDSAAVFDGTNGLCSLTEAIVNADSETSAQPNPDCGPGTTNKFVLDTIILPADTVYTLTGPLPSIHSMILIEGNGSTIRRDPDDRLIHGEISR